MPTRITISDLAHEANVSVSTIDRILSGRGKVKASTVEHVLATAERIGFHAVGSIRSRQGLATPQRRFGFLLYDRDRQFYRDLERQISRNLARHSNIQASAQFLNITELTPDHVAEELLALGESCDAIAGVFLDHPKVRMAIESLSARGIPVMAMLSDVSMPSHQGFIGANDWQLGRSAGWFMSRLLPQGGKVAVLNGNRRFQCQQSFIASFRAFMAEAPRAEFTFVEAPPTLESDLRAEKIVEDLLRDHADLSAIFMTGGGLAGTARALATRPARPFVIGTELTEDTHRALASGQIDMILSHPAKDIARETVEALVQTVLDPTPTEAHPTAPLQKLLPFEVLISENC